MQYVRRPKKALQRRPRSESLISVGVSRAVPLNAGVGRMICGCELNRSLGSVFRIKLGPAKVLGFALPG
jgi:hypothetical protein